MRFLVTLLLFPLFLKAQNPVQVRIHKNIELINVLAVQNAAGLLKDTLTNPWMRDNSVLMRRSYYHFLPVQQLPIFRTYQALEDKMGTGMYLLGLYYSEVPTARRLVALPDVFLEAVSPNRDSVIRAFDQFFGQLNQLYTEVRFADYLRQNGPIYAQAVAEVKRNLPPAGFTKALEQYYGGHKHSYNLILNPYFKSDWGMGWEVSGPAGTDVYNITAPFVKANVSATGQVETTGFDDRAGVRRLSVHEFGHTFVNPLAYQPSVRKQIEAYNSLYEPIKGDEQYSDWHTQFCEYVVRAGEIRIALKTGNPADAEAVRKQNARWKYLPHFVRQLERYETNRRQYPTFEAFLPSLIASLKDLQRGR
ncbi:DUF4932 domain-containing protein [Tellurirhabdus rosea]|uniref:DUF4932 domain-containing protein n=1 Tax=Tellurirhabdus rosea TaxID=2674997 RepID=UPI002256DEB5|nr:DUF4932 domain-containing protein [Tellurirhabdus rosea]